VPEIAAAVYNIGLQYRSGGQCLWAVRNVSLEFQRGTLTLIMGPSGSGKTTLLTLLGCLRKPDEGTVSVESSDMSQLSEARLAEMRRDRIGFVFQAFRLFHSLSARDNVLLTADICGFSARRQQRQRAEELLVSLGLGSRMALKPDQLSGGEKQRVAIARATLMNPPILLADEPTASLDSEAGEQIAGILFRLAEEEQRTVVVVSHDPRWEKFAHRIMELQDGRIKSYKESRVWAAGV
jgi:putative ABC transport system ATP-binding protein